MPKYSAWACRKNEPGMRARHRCYSPLALPISDSPTYLKDNFGAAHSSSQRTSMGSATLLLPVADQNKQRPPDLLPRRALFFC